MNRDGQGQPGPACATCAGRACMPRISTEGSLSLAEAPDSCPMKLMPDVIAKAASEYENPELKEFARQASIQEFEGYEKIPGGLRTVKPRIVELIEFARKCGYRKLGLAFCAGLTREARTLSRILESQGFTVASVCCKVGAVPKEKIGIKPEEKLGGPGEWESMCNPVTQAEVLNTEKVDLAIMLGLCIGHDTLFIKYCRVPMTVIAVKDRVTGHNPLAALYLCDSYYRGMLRKAAPPERPDQKE